MVPPGWAGAGAFAASHGGPIRARRDHGPSGQNAAPRGEGSLMNDGGKSPLTGRSVPRVQWGNLGGRPGRKKQNGKKVGAHGRPVWL